MIQRPFLYQCASLQCPHRTPGCPVPTYHLPRMVCIRVCIRNKPHKLHRNLKTPSGSIAPHSRREPATRLLCVDCRACIRRDSLPLKQDPTPGEDEKEKAADMYAPASLPPRSLPVLSESSTCVHPAQCNTVLICLAHVTTTGPQPARAQSALTVSSSKVHVRVNQHIRFDRHRNWL